MRMGFHDACEEISHKQSAAATSARFCTPGTKDSRNFKTSRIKIFEEGDFPDHPVVKISCFQSKGCGFDP